MGTADMGEATPPGPSRGPWTDEGDPGVSVTEWRRYGHHRAVVVLADGTKVGYRCLATGADHPTDPVYAALLASAVDAWRAGAARSDARGHASPLSPDAIGVPTFPLLPEPAPYAPGPGLPATTEPWSDLAAHQPGGTPLGGVSREQRTAHRAAQLVGAQLTRLTRRDPRWRALHAVPVGTGDAGIDHVVVGPGGVYVLLACWHAGKRMWVGGDTVMVNNRRLPHVRHARHEARRAARLLSGATGGQVDVTGVVVPVKLLELIVHTAPGDVEVVRRTGVGRWLAQRPAVLDPVQVGRVHDQARRSTTWVR